MMLQLTKWGEPIHQRPCTVLMLDTTFLSYLPSMHTGKEVWLLDPVTQHKRASWLLLKKILVTVWGIVLVADMIKVSQRCNGRRTLSKVTYLEPSWVCRFKHLGCSLPRLLIATLHLSFIKLHGSWHKSTLNQVHRILYTAGCLSLVTTQIPSIGLMGEVYNTLVLGI